MKRPVDVCVQFSFAWFIRRERENVEREKGGGEREGKRGRVGKLREKRDRVSFFFFFFFGFILFRERKSISKDFLLEREEKS